MENGNGDRKPLNGEKGIFLSAPTGLGVTLSPSFADLQKGFFRTTSGDSEPQATVACDLVFIGENAYADYRDFVDWCASTGNLYLIYKPYGTTEFHRQVQMNYMTKTELTDTRWLTVPTSLACLSPWYRAAPIQMSMTTETGNVMKYSFRYTPELIYSSSSAGSMAADLVSEGHIPAAFVLTYTGEVVNPRITLKGVSTGKTYGDCALNLTLTADQQLTISTLYGNSYAQVKNADGTVEDVLDCIDLANEPFPRIPMEESCTLYLTTDSSIQGTATIKVYYYYRSV